MPGHLDGNVASTSLCSDKHRRIVRFTWPIWTYLSLTGVIVYLMLYHLAPALHG